MTNQNTRAINDRPIADYDAKQTRACERTREYLMSAISQLQEGLNLIGTDKLSDLLDSVSSDVTKAACTNGDICCDMVEGY